MTSANVYINFNGACRQAMAFYQECIGGDLQMMPIAGSPMEAQCPPAMKDAVLHSSLVKDALVIMAADLTGPEGYTKGTNMAISVNCSTEDELNTFFEKLSSGGTVQEEPRKQFWGSIFCAFTDKFGIRWMLNCHS
jgi:PhnB protein